VKDRTSPKLPPHKRVASRWRALGRGIQWTIIALVVLLIAARLAMPYAIKSYANHQLAKNPTYSGSIGDVWVHLYRGAYEIKNINISKLGGQVPVPFFAAKKIDLSMEWKELFHGALVGEVEIYAPQLNFVSGPTPEKTQDGTEGDWANTLKSLFPFKINRLQINGGRIHFQNFYSTPQVDIHVNDLFATATNLTNTRDLPHELPSGVVARGNTIGGGQVQLETHMNLLAEKPAFELTAQVTNVDLVALNDFLKAYGKFDVERGRFALFGSFAVAEGKYDGYAKVFFDNLDVFDWEKERKKNILQIFWQAIVGGVSTVFRNLPKDQLATKIPISGAYENSSIGTWSAISTLLKNAFISALVPKLDRSIKVEEVKEKPPKESKSSDSKSSGSSKSSDSESSSNSSPP
jgi:hypothetical protein